jgi:hypothetical protein
MKTSSRTVRSVRFGTIPILNGNMYGESYRASHQSADIVPTMNPFEVGYARRCGAKSNSARPSIPTAGFLHLFLTGNSNFCPRLPTARYCGPATSTPLQR